MEIEWSVIERVKISFSSCLEKRGVYDYLRASIISCKCVADRAHLPNEVYFGREVCWHMSVGESLKHDEAEEFVCPAQLSEYKAPVRILSSFCLIL